MASELPGMVFLGGRMPELGFVQGIFCFFDTRNNIFKFLLGNLGFFLQFILLNVNLLFPVFHIFRLKQLWNFID